MPATLTPSRSTLDCAASTGLASENVRPYRDLSLRGLEMLQILNDIFNNLSPDSLHEAVIKTSCNAD